ncbi:hypothetical protein [Escherichia phage AV105]|nr:hypothetical protein [Escherichia phage AV105]
MSDYSVVMGKSLPGCLVDTTRYNIDGCCVCTDESILVGKAVFITKNENGYKMITTNKTGDSVLMGVSIRSQIVTSMNEEDGYTDYKEGDPISVATMGKVWALTESIDSAPKPGDKVYVDNDGFIATVGDNLADGWSFTGDFEKLDETFNIVGVYVRRKIVHIHKLTAAIIEDTEGNKPDGNRFNNSPVTLKVTVEPDWATDKSGRWEISIGSEHASLEEIEGGSKAKITPNGTTGEVYINWTSNDGSGVADTFRINFIDQS